VLGAVLVFPLLVDGNAEVEIIAVRGELLFGVFALASPFFNGKAMRLPDRWH
jgi:hypothetical protein